MSPQLLGSVFRRKGCLMLIVPHEEAGQLLLFLGFLALQLWNTSSRKRNAVQLADESLPSFNIYFQLTYLSIFLS
uniref:Uncharacterized protein MANES_11G116800 n=1 Tax=Rhizophora mucronata TaxID=61149 RepID=A0A2P2MVU8_RHIMU